MNFDLSVFSLPQFSSLPVKIEEVEQEMTLLLPFYTKQALQTESIKVFPTLQIIHELKKTTKEWIDSLKKIGKLPDLSLPDFSTLTPKQQLAIHHHIKIANELE